MKAFRSLVMFRVLLTILATGFTMVLAHAVPPQPVPGRYVLDGGSGDRFLRFYRAGSYPQATKVLQTLMTHGVY